jgi:hypothetical protein
LLDRLPAELAERPRRRDLLSSAEHHAGVIAATVPSVRERLNPLSDALRSANYPASGDVTAVHGDLYEAQLLVDRGRITGLLDVDTAGAGLRIDDLANFCAHLSVLALTADRPKHMKRYGADLLAYAERDHPPRILRPPHRRRRAGTGDRAIPGAGDRLGTKHLATPRTGRRVARRTHSWLMNELSSPSQTLFIRVAHYGHK